MVGRHWSKIHQRVAVTPVRMQSLSDALELSEFGSRGRERDKFGDEALLMDEDFSINSCDDWSKRCRLPSNYANVLASAAHCPSTRRQSRSGGRQMILNV